MAIDTATTGSPEARTRAAAAYTKLEAMRGACLALGFIALLVQDSIVAVLSDAFDWPLEEAKILAPAIVPVVLLIAYVWLGLLLSNRADVDRASFANSIYFIGFLFTLGALVWALFGAALNIPSLPAEDFAQLTAAQGAARQAELTASTRSLIAATVAQSGVALTTTIVGLVARILIVKFERRDPDDLEEAQAQLVDALRQASRGIDAARVAYSATNAAYTQDLAEARRAVSDSATRLAGRLDDIRAPSDAVTAAVRERFDSLQDAAKTLTEELARASTEAKKAVSIWSDLGATAAPTAEERKALAEAGRTLAQTAGTVQFVAEEQRRAFEATDNAIGRIADRQSQMLQQLAVATDQLWQRSNAVREALEAIDRTMQNRSPYRPLGR